MLSRLRPKVPVVTTALRSSTLCLRRDVAVVASPRRTDCVRHLLFATPATLLHHHHRPSSTSPHFPFSSQTEHSIASGHSSTNFYTKQETRPQFVVPESPFVRYVEALLFRLCTTSSVSGGGGGGGGGATNPNSCSDDASPAMPAWVSLAQIQRCLPEEHLEQLGNYKNGLREVIGVALADNCELQKNPSTGQWQARTLPRSDQLVRIARELNAAVKNNNGVPIHITQLRPHISTPAFLFLRESHRRAPVVVAQALNELPGNRVGLERKLNGSIFLYDLDVGFRHHNAAEAYHDHDGEGIGGNGGASSPPASWSSTMKFELGNTPRNKFVPSNSAALKRLFIEDLLDYIPSFFIPLRLALEQLEPLGYSKEHIERFFLRTTRALQIVTISAPNWEQKEASSSSQFIRVHGRDGNFDMSNIIGTNERFKQYEPLPSVAAPFLEELRLLRRRQRQQGKHESGGGDGGSDNDNSSSRDDQSADRTNSNGEGWMPLRTLLEKAGPEAEAALPYQGPEALLYFAQMQHLFNFSPQNGGMVALAFDYGCCNSSNDISVSSPTAGERNSQVIGNQQQADNKITNDGNDGAAIAAVAPPPAEEGVVGDDNDDDGDVHWEQEEEEEEEVGNVTRPVMYLDHETTPCPVFYNQLFRLLRLHITLHLTTVESEIYPKPQTMLEVQRFFPTSFQDFVLAHSATFSFDPATSLVSLRGDGSGGRASYQHHPHWKRDAQSRAATTSQIVGHLPPHVIATTQATRRERRRLAAERNPNNPLLDEENFAKALFELLPRPNLGSSSSSRRPTANHLTIKQLKWSLPQELVEVVPEQGLVKLLRAYPQYFQIFHITIEIQAVMRADCELPECAVRPEDISEKAILMMLVRYVQEHDQQQGNNHYHHQHHHHGGGGVSLMSLAKRIPRSVRVTHFQANSKNIISRLITFMEQYPDLFVIVQSGGTSNVVLGHASQELLR